MRIATRARPKRDGNREARIQGAVVEYIRTVAPQCRLHSVPNGGYAMDERAVARLKWTGLLPGVWDLVLAMPGSRVAYIEIKAPRGRLSKHQQDFRDWMIVSGVMHAVLSSVDEARVALAAWNVETRESVASRLSEYSEGQPA